MPEEIRAVKRRFAIEVHESNDEEMDFCPIHVSVGADIRIVNRITGLFAPTAYDIQIDGPSLHFEGLADVIALRGGHAVIGSGQTDI